MGNLPAEVQPDAAEPFSVVGLGGGFDAVLLPPAGDQAVDLGNDGGVRVPAHAAAVVLRGEVGQGGEQQRGGGESDEHGGAGLAGERTGTDSHSRIMTRPGRPVFVAFAARRPVSRSFPPVPAPIARMTVARPTAADLRGGRCVPCEGGVPTLSRAEVDARLAVLDGWEIVDDGTAIRRTWNAGNFSRALAFFVKIGDLAEAEGHHPDLHLTGYRHAAVVLTTHAVGGLTENDFILAAKIDALGGP